MRYGPRILETIYLSPKTAFAITGRTEPLKWVSIISMLDDGNSPPFHGPYAVILSRGWLAKNFPRAWAAWVLDKGVFILTADEIAIYARTDAD